MKFDKITMEMFGRLMMIIGGLNYIIIFVTGENVIKYKIAMVIIGVAALYFAFDRDYYLPFLGKTAFPVQHEPNLMKLHKSEFKKQIKITGVPPNVNVVYWAAGKGESEKVFSNYKEAYGNYENSGNVMSDKDGEAILEIVCPAKYKVNKYGMIEEELEKHVHYRYEIPEYKGMYSQVYTRYVNKEC